MYQYKQSQTKKKNKLTLDSKIKVTLTSFWYAALRLVPMYICTKYHAGRPIDVSYAPDKNVNKKGKTFDLRLIGQGYSDLVLVCDTRSCPDIMEVGL